MKTESQLIEILKLHKLRVTPVRKEVLSLFLNQEMAISHGDIERSIDEIDRITLYRTLKSFEEKGIIHKAVDGTDVAKYALCEAHCNDAHHNDNHVHFHCEKCGNTFCIEDVEIPDIRDVDGFIVKSTHMVLSGMCKKCN